MVSRSSSGSNRTCARGFTYVAVLIAVAVLGVGLGAVSEVWVKTLEHRRLVQMDWVGSQYVQAIGRYYYSNTGLVHYYPQKLDDLLVDRRYLSVKRHIRFLYLNPFDEQLPDVVPVVGQVGIVGVVMKMPSGMEPAERRYVFLPSVTQH